MTTYLTHPPTGAATDCTITQGWHRYSAQEPAMCDQLFARQLRVLGSGIIPGQPTEGINIKPRDFR